jgi:hypothetical protein
VDFVIFRRSNWALTYNGSVDQFLLKLRVSFTSFTAPCAYAPRRPVDKDWHTVSRKSAASLKNCLRKIVTDAFFLKIFSRLEMAILQRNLFRFTGAIPVGTGQKKS